jgi:hypothetical protein
MNWKSASGEWTEMQNGFNTEVLKPFQAFFNQRPKKLFLAGRLA